MNEQAEILAPSVPARQRKVLAVLRDEGKYHELVGDGLEDIELEFHPTAASASQALAAGDPPWAVLTDLQLSDCSGLELLGVLDTLGIRIPVLILVPGPRPVRVEQDHPFLTVLPEVSHQRMPGIVAAAVQRAADAPDQPMFRVLDYLRLALELKLSVVLRLHLAAGIDLQLDILGGDLWNAYTEDESGLRILSTLAKESPKLVASRYLQALPSERQIHKSPSEILRSLSHGGQARRSPPRSLSRETQPLDLLGLVPIRGQVTLEVADSAQRASAKAVVAKTVATKTVADEDYKNAISRGIDAALHRDFAGAIRAFEAALELRPGDSQARYNLKRMQDRVKR